MTDFENMKLGINPKVRGRDHQGNRVTYQLWNNSDIDQPAISEKVVLKRFRARSGTTHTYDGARLHPGVWRAVDSLLSQHPGLFDYLAQGPDGESRVIAALEEMREPLMMEGLKLRGTMAIATMLFHCGPQRVSALVARHREPERRAHPGVPDLFLMVANLTSRRLVRACFAEVKRPDEPLAAHQAEELRFMRSLGLEAGVFRLKEVGDGRLMPHAA